MIALAQITLGEFTKKLEEKVTFLDTLFDALFGCWHARLSFPITNKRGQRRPTVAYETGTYVVCLDCGKEFGYDWQKMRILHPRKQPIYASARVEAEAS